LRPRTLLFYITYFLLFFFKLGYNGIQKRFARSEKNLARRAQPPSVYTAAVQWITVTVDHIGCTVTCPRSISSGELLGSSMHAWAVNFRLFAVSLTAIRELLMYSPRVARRTAQAADRGGGRLLAERTYPRLLVGVLLVFKQNNGTGWDNNRHVF
jgi:hypothetical protein